MTVLVSYLCLLCAVTGAFAEDRQACSTTMDGTCAMEEGLEMLQSKATKVTAHGETSVDKAGKEKAVEKTNKTNSSHDANKSHVRGEYEFERPLLDESDIEKIRFRARHQDWIDIFELYKDGFLKRYHAHDAGTWHLNKDNQLIFNWLKWGAEQAAMQSTDHGKTFNSTGKTKFELKSYVQPLWWRTQFDGSNVAYLQEQAKKKNKKEIFADTKEIIRAHASGRKADLDEEGYLAVAMLKDDDEMRDFIHRLADSMNLQIMKEGGVSGLLPYYSGSSSYQTLHKLKDELLKGANKKKGVRWILHDDDPELALLQVEKPSSSKKSSSKESTHAEHEKESTHAKHEKEIKLPHAKHETKAAHLQDAEQQDKDIEKAHAVLKERTEAQKKAEEAAQKAMQERLNKQMDAENELLAKERDMRQEEKQNIIHEEQVAKAKQLKHREEEKQKKEKAAKESKHKDKKETRKEDKKEESTSKKDSSLLEVKPHEHKKQEIDFEMSALQESDIEKVRFRARHEDWIDILELYKDGFFQRYHAHDAGLWHLDKNNQLVLKWLQWGEEAALHSTDAGTSFKTTGVYNFSLKSYVQPVWWRKQFDGALLQEQSGSAQSKKASTMDAKEIIRAHVNGMKAPLDESGYLAVTQLKDNDEMVAFIRRVAESLDLDITNEGGLNGVAPYYSGDREVQTLKKLQNELITTARSKTKKHSRWIVDREEQQLALLQAEEERKIEEKLKEQQEQEIEFEKPELEESDIEKIRFRARHDDWIDILDLYRDGFFKRYHDHDVGVWHLNKKNELVLKWLKWGEEEMLSQDGGKSFKKPSKERFTLKSYVQPRWWRSHFEDSNEAELQELSKKSKKDESQPETEKPLDMKAIIAAHVDGTRADLDENGYQALAFLKNDHEMGEFVKRVVESMGMVVVNDGGLAGMVPFYSGTNTYQTLGKLKKEVTRIARAKEGERWVMDQNGQPPQGSGLSLLQEQAVEESHDDTAEKTHDDKKWWPFGGKTSQDGKTEHEKKEKVLDASSKNSSKSAKPHYEEIELEKDLLEESDIEKIRFRAKHDDWMDILDLYKDGFFKRYHDGDLGVWHQNKKNQLVLKWLKWGEEELQSSDDGKSFLGGGKGQFSLKSYKQPVWWRRNFDASSDSELQELSHESKTSHKSKSIKSHTDDMMAIIGNHVNGKLADLNERGYELVALQKKPEEMNKFIRRVVASMHMSITNEGGLNGIVPYYSGEITYQTLAKLKDEIMTTARRPEGERWVMDQGGDDPSRAAL